jgi:autotransporter-associated beta strand protein
MLGVNSNAAPGPNSGGGIFNLSGTGSLNMTTASGATGDALLEIGRSDTTANNTTNLFNQTGGTANVGILTLGGSTGGSTGVSATLSITGGSFSARQFTKLSAGNTNTSVITIGGTADVTLPAFPTARGTGSTATVFFDGGVLKPSATSAAYLGGLSNAYIQDGGAKFHTNSFDITVSQNLLTDALSTGGGLTKEGAGTLSLTGSNSYTGNTSVTAGTLSLGSGTANSNLADAADVIIASGATVNLNFSGTDTIKSLIINGVTKSSGVWGAPGSGAANTDPVFTGTGTLTVTTGSDDYATWSSSYSLSGGMNADDDGDGLSNFSEYAFGLIPTSGSSVNPISQVLNQTTGIFKYSRRATPATTNVSYTYEYSTSLEGSWTTFTPESATSNSATPTEEITVDLPDALLTNTKLFVRVKAVKP